MDRKRLLIGLATGALLVTMLPAAVSAAGPAPAWTRQFGSTADDFVNDVVVDSNGRVAVVGETIGAFSGQTYEGDDDAFVRVYKRGGRHAWTRQFGTTDGDIALGVAVDGRNRIIVVGGTEGTLPDQSSVGDGDAFVRVYNPDGSVAWTRQFGSTGFDEAMSVAVDKKGRIVVAGTAGGDIGAQENQGGLDAFVSVFRPNGQHVWTKVFGSAVHDEATGVAVDGNRRVIVVGFTRGTLRGRKSRGNADAFVQVFQWNGQYSWTRQFGTGDHDGADDVAVDGAGRIAVVGITNGAMAGTNKGMSDVFIRVYKAAGRAAWTRQFGSDKIEYGNSVAIDRLGRVIVAGETQGFLPGQRQNAAGLDAFVKAYRRDGRGAWTRQFGSGKVGNASPADWAVGVTVDRSNRVAVAGSTNGVLTSQPEKGGYDGFLRVYRQ